MHIYEHKLHQKKVEFHKNLIGLGWPEKSLSGLTKRRSVMASAGFQEVITPPCR